MPSFRNALKQHIPPQVQRFIVKLLTSQKNTLPRLIYGQATYNYDGLVTTHNADFMSEPRFVEAYAAGKSTNSWRDGEVYWRAFVVCWAATKAAQLPGDFVECGVYRGGYSMTAMKYVQFEHLPKKFYLLDTYQGLVEKYISPEERSRGIETGGYEDSYDAVVRSFSQFQNVEVIKGAVPETLPLVKADQISYLSIDMNTRDPEIAAAEYFWDKLVSGGVMLLDDYGWRKHFEQKIAFDEFARQRNVMVLPLPTGQGLIFKP